MPQTVTIENPILDSPYEEPRKHFAFGQFVITSEVVETRRVFSYFIPIAQVRVADQCSFDAEWTRDRMKENTKINRIRSRTVMGS